MKLTTCSRSLCPRTGVSTVYHAMTEPRPHRPARTPEAAASELRREARAGRLDSEAVNAVLAAAGHRVRTTRRELVAGLSEREVEVLRLLARGNSMKQVAGLLTISEKRVTTEWLFLTFGQYKWDPPVLKIIPQ